MRPIDFALVAGLFYTAGRHDGGSSYITSLRFGIAWAVIVLVVSCMSHVWLEKASKWKIALFVICAPFVGALASAFGLI